MCFFGGSSAPALPAAPAPVDTTDTSSDTAVTASNNAKQKAAAAAGLQSTIASSPLGDTSTATVSRPSLLGMNG